MNKIVLHAFSLAVLGLSFLPARAGAEWIWIEGEAPAVNKMNRHPWWYDKVHREQLSGGDFISNFDEKKPGEAEYVFKAAAAGEFDFWLRANPVKSKLSYHLNGGAETDVDFNGGKRDETNIAADGKPDLRFIAWINVGKVQLHAGENRISFRMTSGPQNHGIIDCMVFSSEPFVPRGILKPDQMAGELKRLAEENRAWFAFDPKPDPFALDSAIDLRFLNEKFAGEGGFIGVKNGEFIHTRDGMPMRFWAVNGPPADLKGEELRNCARMLAKHGVNMVRFHGGYFNKDGELDEAKVKHALDVVAAMKAEGIYTHFSIYFPLWFEPRANHPWLEGYDGKKHPFAALFFNPKFQEHYRAWWTALLTTPGPDGRTLVDEPAVASLEMQNEDSFFFWTFGEANIPDPQLRILEKMFGDWLAKKYGTPDAAFAAWKSQKLKRDAPAEGRVAFRPLWNMFSEKTARDCDTAQFLFELQMKFYADTHAFLRTLGFKGPITASNWTTASPEIFGPLEKLSYSAGDFIDRHGYFGCLHKGQDAGWSLRNGHTYADRCGLRFEAEEPGKPRQFTHPAMDPHYNGMPSMISEIAWNRPNRFRSEEPLYLACYGALQHSDAIVQFALDGAQWSVKPGFFMQPWTLMSPAMMGQFPATALIFRRSLIAPGDVLAKINLNRGDLLHLKGTPLPQDASLDELRLKDVPQGGEVKSGQRIDPLIHYAGRVDVNFSDTPSSANVSDLKPFINHESRTIASTTGELKLDYEKGLLVINAPRAQGVSGQLKSTGSFETKDLLISSDMEIGHIIAVSLDDKPLAESQKILLQVMSEEKTTDFQTEPALAGTRKIVLIGHDPWLVKTLAGTVKFKRADAANLSVTELDFNGSPVARATGAQEIKLQPATVYYLIGR